LATPGRSLEDPVAVRPDGVVGAAVQADAALAFAVYSLRNRQL
jgi:hypothetical protein